MINKPCYMAERIFTCKQIDFKMSSLALHSLDFDFARIHFWLLLLDYSNGTVFGTQLLTLFNILWSQCSAAVQHINPVLIPSLLPIFCAGCCRSSRNLVIYFFTMPVCLYFGETRFCKIFGELSSTNLTKFPGLDINNKKQEYKKP